MAMLKDPSTKYKPFPTANLPDRQWPSKTINKPPHRGCAVAPAELAQIAGANRVEGCPFGNGEHTGTVDPVTPGLNPYTQGIHLKIDLSDLERAIDTVEVSTKISDAIMKDFQIRNSDHLKYEDQWDIPYLPLDPANTNHTYEAVICVNSHSAKGGAA
ncbi:hypothetical protein G7Z17_g5902 [Cylindrodendrum hubeiense]|uniref:2-isopropylmalate synthase n=1 Tax=Cylindrodendrum hubeiense TaxID=595255 RepID=A0A9P5LBB5_9HYPO|nr:hypothetical protein G7Z17_g5902 [Cylindrodendrum hubeiense]